MKMALQILPNKIDKSITLLPEKATFSLIWLHGLGDSSAGFFQYFQLPQSPVFKGCKVRLLQAPQRAVTINGGYMYNSWYDVKSFAGSGNDEDRYDYDQINDSLSIIEKNVTEEISFWKEQGIKDSQEHICRRIFVGGFSQGCAMSLTYGLTSKRLLAGIVGLSGYLFDGFNLVNKGSIPILAYHGKQDDLLNYSWSKSSYERHLKNIKGFQFKGVDGLHHSVTVQELEEATGWMLQQLINYGIKT